MIALSGLDGAGKSTQAHALADALERLGYDLAVEWTRLGDSERLRPVKHGSQAPAATSVTTMPGALVRRRRAVVHAEMRATGLALETAWRQWRRASGFLARDYVVVCDRHTLDWIVSLRYPVDARRRFPIQRPLLCALTRRPAVAYLLDVAPETAWRRKGELGVEALRRHHAPYHEERARLGVARLAPTRIAAIAMPATTRGCRRTASAYDNPAGGWSSWRMVCRLVATLRRRRRAGGVRCADEGGIADMTLGPQSSIAAGARRARVAAPAIVASGTLLAVLMTGVTAVAPSLGVLALAPLLAVPILLGGPVIALAALAALLFMSRLPPFGFAATAMLVFVGALWVEARWARPGRARVATAAPRATTPAFVGLLLWLGLSIGWARHAGPAEVKLEDWVVAAALFGVVTTTVRTPSHVLVVVRAFIAGAVVSVVVGLAAAVLAPGGALEQRTWFEARLQGGAGDPNLLAAGLVAAIALAVGALGTTRRGSLERRALVAALVVLVAGLGATQSRGGVIAAIAATATAIALSPGRRVRGVLGAGAVAVILVAALAASPGGLPRVLTPDAEGSGRADLWRVAARMVHTEPVLGVGLANFAVRSPDFVQAPGALQFADLVAERPHEVHNTYLQLLAEAGLPGLLAYMTVVGLALSTAWRAQRRLAALGERELATLARSVLVGAVGMLVALVFVTDGDDMRLWILLGLGPALLGTAAGRTGRSADRLTRASGLRSAS